MPDWFSKDMEYWNPEQPPPTTPMRRPAGSGSWVAMISRTLLTALSVSRTGVAFGGAAASGVAGKLVVAMNQSLLGTVSTLSVYRRRRQAGRILPLCGLDVVPGGSVASQ